MATNESPWASPFGSGFFDDFLEEQPDFAFNAFLNQGRRSPNQRDFLRSSQSDIFDMFKGQLGQQILGGQAPTARFTDFLKDFDFNNYFMNTPPLQAGRGTSRFAPNVRWQV